MPEKPKHYISVLFMIKNVEKIDYFMHIFEAIIGKKLFPIHNFAIMQH